MINIKYTSGAQRLIGFTSANDYTIQLQQVPLNSPTVSADSLIKDAYVRTETYVPTLYDYNYTFNYNLDQSPPTLAYTSGPATVVAGRIQATGPGIATFTTRGVYGSRELQLPMSSGASWSQSVFTGTFQAGSLGVNIKGNLQSYINGKTPDNSIVQRFSSITPAITASAFQATKNPNLITGALDLSWLGIWRVYPEKAPEWNGYGAFPAAVISKRHIICARHIGAATRTIFQKQDGSFVQVDLVSGDDVIVNGNVTDCKVYYVDTDLSGLIDPVLFAPTSGAHRIQLKTPTLYGYTGIANYGVPALVSLNNESTYSPTPSEVTFYGGQKMLITDINSATSWGKPSDPELAKYYYYPYNGDSSSMVFFPVTQGGSVKCVLMSSLLGPATGPAYSSGPTQAAMVALMRSLAAAQGDNFAYDLTYADLSAFTSY